MHVRIEMKSFIFYLMNIYFVLHAAFLANR